MSRRPSRKDTRVQRIKIAQKQLGIEEDDYRAMLQRLTGKSSAADLTGAEKDEVLAEMERLGFEPQPRKGGRKWSPREERRDIRYIHVLWRLLTEKGVVENGRHALNSFVCGPKFHKKYSEAPTDVKFLSIDRARDVIEALKDMCRRNGVVLKQ